MNAMKKSVFFCANRQIISEIWKRTYEFQLQRERMAGWSINTNTYKWFCTIFIYRLCLMLSSHTCACVCVLLSLPRSKKKSVRIHMHTDGMTFNTFAWMHHSTWKRLKDKNFVMHTFANGFLNTEEDQKMKRRRSNGDKAIERIVDTIESIYCMPLRCTCRHTFIWLLYVKWVRIGWFFFSLFLLHAWTYVLIM